ncbi:uncharacterized protein LOC105695076 [Orussus abietinus]|uniref:uncharacterized protein LOC105695076 n=1 Tax=Orussus abietinus TaxID=222816 RepID=UPI0006265E9A|nr:uncharacterized protein LOC105695076 [Orussus abietinus]XP_012271764.1 uncharacterized protein LOC105695076 [Orussus abietinus]XP_012271765.1 uncharacterized protein LOC105695076 [Orussus abietinus]
MSGRPDRVSKNSGKETRSSKTSNARRNTEGKNSPSNSLNKVVEKTDSLPLNRVDNLEKKDAYQALLQSKHKEADAVKEKSRYRRSTRSAVGSDLKKRKHSELEAEETDEVQGSSDAQWWTFSRTETISGKVQKSIRKETTVLQKALVQASQDPRQRTLAIMTQGECHLELRLDESNKVNERVGTGGSNKSLLDVDLSDESDVQELGLKHRSTVPLPCEVQWKNIFSRKKRKESSSKSETADSRKGRKHQTSNQRLTGNKNREVPDSRLNGVGDIVECIDLTIAGHIDQEVCEPEPLIFAPRPSDEELEKMFCEIESRYSGARQIWKMVQSKMLNNNVKGPGNVTNQYCIWTDKYKPKNAAEVIGNEKAAVQLRNWLSNWQKKKVNSGECYSSGDEFCSTDSNASSVTSTTGGVAVLIGPHGCGKSAIVYAVSEELGYNVLEVNASSKRTGKGILKSLQEATMSHRINNDLGAYLSFPVKSEKSTNDSLILMEDVDIVFQEDEGFISASNMLASNSKRPIIMTSRHACSYMKKMAPQQIYISCKPANSAGAAALLDVISLEEVGRILPRSCINSLLHKGDLRQALLQLQCMLVLDKLPSVQRTELGSDQVEKRSSMNEENFQPARERRAHRSKNKCRKSESSECDDLARIADDLVNLSTAQQLVDRKEAPETTWELEPGASLSLAEDFSCFSIHEAVGSEMSDTLMESVLRLNDDNSHIRESLKLSKTQRTNSSVSALSELIPCPLDCRQQLDYLSGIRTICRIENVKAKVKRGNRFFHYLQDIMMIDAPMKPALTATICKALRVEPSG